MNAYAHVDSKGGMASSSRDARNLVNLGETASTSRVLNLSRIYLSSAHEPEYRNKPFFRNAQMNKAIIVKHTLRANERDLFARPRRTATKIILPFDPNDLKLGGRSILVGQTGFDSFCRGYFNTDDLNAHQDVQTLRLLDTLPSLDPFLVREHLARNNFRPAACYLKIAPYDVQRMISFTNEEIERLVRTAFADVLSAGAAVKLADKILSNELDTELAPLKTTLRMTDAEFSDGIFSWRGFLYFKWRHIELREELRKVLEGLASYQPIGACDDALREYLKIARPRLAQSIVAAIRHVGRILIVYDQAYHALVEGENAGPFRRFLLDGPEMFFELGESIGILSHIGSFWAYRMNQSLLTHSLTPLEYGDILMDFEDSLSLVSHYSET
ncbi:hypothetical protein [Asticcacaulis sp. EMRT-3]|uniref:hypothetical protein n=1 Tax=Asticcacaulis sp. EMRT-3 TaxID=3040349 RepID=UPI0024AFC7DE|nr:hypothetical protein [Asticcacaulis sp. EMRT-3]MDI7776111.1 hypothetical protein [Asticcacaulis sp. EMRT-3]